MSTINYDQVFESPGKFIKAFNRQLQWKTSDSDSVQTQNREAQVLFTTPSGTIFYPDEYQVTGESFRNMSIALAAALDGARLTASSSFAASLAPLIRRIINGETGVIPITALDLDTVITGMSRNMDNEGPVETIKKNVVTVGTPTYKDSENQGDLGTGANPWDGVVTAAVNADFGQMGRNGVITLRVASDGFVNQNLERWELRLTIAESPGTTLLSLVQFFTEATGTPITDISLNLLGDPIGQLGTAVNTGLDIGIKPPDYSSNLVTNDPNTSLTLVDPRVKEVTKTPFLKSNITFQPSAGTRNGRFFVNLDRLVGPDRIIITVYDDASLTTQLSEQFTYTFGDGDFIRDFLINDNELALFPTFDAGDKLVKLGFVGAQLELYAASQVVFVDTPLPFAIGDESCITLASDNAGVFQSFFVEQLRRFLPSDTVPTVLDSLAT